MYIVGSMRSTAVTLDGGVRTEVHGRAHMRAFYNVTQHFFEYLNKYERD